MRHAPANIVSVAAFSVIDIELGSHGRVLHQSIEKRDAPVVLSLQLMPQAVSNRQRTQ